MSFYFINYLKIMFFISINKMQYLIFENKRE